MAKKNKVKDKDSPNLPVPLFDIDLPYPYLEMDIGELEKSDTLEELLAGPVKPVYNLKDLEPQERKVAYTLRQLYDKLIKLYEKPHKTRVYEVKYVGPLIHMFTRTDGKPVKYVTAIEAEYVCLLMNEIHSQVIRAISWQEISNRLLIDMFRLKKLWARYQNCISGFDLVDAKYTRNLHMERCEYVLSRIMVLALKKDDLRHWLGVLKALEPISVMVKDQDIVIEDTKDEKQNAIERMKRIFAEQKDRWIEEGRRMERQKVAIDITPGEETKFLESDEDIPPEHKTGIGDIFTS
jgi:hypothetical protein